MRPEMRRLIRWFDRKTGQKLDLDVLVADLAKLPKVPPPHQEALRKYRKKGKEARESLVASYLISRYSAELP